LLVVLALASLPLGCGAEHGSLGDLATDSGSGGESGCGTAAGGWTGTDVLDCSWMWNAVDFVPSMIPFDRLEMTVEGWSSSDFMLSSSEGSLGAAWPSVSGYATVAPVVGETVVVAEAQCTSADWHTYARVEDMDGRLLWEGGGIGEGSCQPEEPRLRFSDVATGETCRHGDGRVVIPTAVEVASDDEPTIVPSGETRQVTISGDPYVVHVLAAQIQLTEDDECSGWPDYTSSVYLARLE